MRLLLLLPITLCALPALTQVNDDCTGALGLTVDAGCLQATTELLNATESLPPILCSGWTAGEANDVWFTFVASGDETRLRAAGTSLDLVLEAFSGGCAALVSEGCADAFALNGEEQLQISTVPGTSYHVRVYAWNYVAPPTNLEFWICAVPGTPPPANDQCPSVVPVALVPGDEVQFSGTTVGATIGGDYVVGSPLNWAGPAVWHAFDLQGCAASVTVSYCGTVPVFQNTLVVLARTCPADTLIYAINWDQNTCSEPNVTFRLDTLQAGVYYLPVLWDPAVANGPYQVKVATSACPVGVAEFGGMHMEPEVRWDAAAGTLLVDLGPNIFTGDLQCVDMSGRVILQRRWPLGAQRHSVEMPPALPAGVYLLRLLDASGSFTRRWVAY